MPPKTKRLKGKVDEDAENESGTDVTQDQGGITGSAVCTQFTSTQYAEGLGHNDCEAGK